MLLKLCLWLYTNYLLWLGLKWNPPLAICYVSRNQRFFLWVWVSYCGCKMLFVQFWLIIRSVCSASFPINRPLHSFLVSLRHHLHTHNISFVSLFNIFYCYFERKRWYFFVFESRAEGWRAQSNMCGLLLVAIR